MYVSFSRYSGPYELDDTMPTKSSQVIAAGDALTDSTGLAPAATDNEIHGIALQARVSVANQTPIQIMIILDRTKFYGEAESGTFVHASDVNVPVDLASADGLAADVSTNDDWLVRKVLSTTQAIGQFTHVANTFR